MRKILMKWRQVIYLIEFNVAVIEMLTELQRRMDEQSENCNKEIGNIR